jgi:hypothetical protein
MAKTSTSIRAVRAVALVTITVAVLPATEAEEVKD